MFSIASTDWSISDDCANVVYNQWWKKKQLFWYWQLFGDILHYKCGPNLTKTSWTQTNWGFNPDQIQDLIWIQPIFKMWSNPLARVGSDYWPQMFIISIKATLYERMLLMPFCWLCSAFALLVCYLCSLWWNMLCSHCLNFCSSVMSGVPRTSWILLTWSNSFRPGNKGLRLEDTETGD